MPTTTEQAKPLWQRLLWFSALWAGSVAALGVVGYGIKLVLKN